MLHSLKFENWLDKQDSPYEGWLAIEVDNNKIDNYWRRFSKGGQYSRYYYPIYLLINWGRESQDIAMESGARIQGRALYGQPGITWPWLTSKGFNPRLLPSNTIFANISPNLALQEDDIYPMLGFLASNLASDLLDKITPSRNYTVEQVNNLPADHVVKGKLVEHLTKQIVDLKIKIDSFDEISPYFNAGLISEACFDKEYKRFSNLIETSFNLYVELDREIQFEFNDIVSEARNIDKDILSNLFQSKEITANYFAKLILSFCFGALSLRAVSTQLQNLL